MLRPRRETLLNMVPVLEKKLDFILGTEDVIYVPLDKISELDSLICAYNVTFLVMKY